MARLAVRPGVARRSAAIDKPANHDIRLPASYRPMQTPTAFKAGRRRMAASLRQSHAPSGRPNPIGEFQLLGKLYPKGGNERPELPEESYRLKIPEGSFAALFTAPQLSSASKRLAAQAFAYRTVAARNTRHAIITKPTQNTVRKIKAPTVRASNGVPASA